jgi:hypothetical protein
LSRSERLDSVQVTFLQLDFSAFANLSEFRPIGSQSITVLGGGRQFKVTAARRLDAGDYHAAYEELVSIEASAADQPLLRSRKPSCRCSGRRRAA